MDVFNRRGTQPAGVDRRPNAVVILARALRVVGVGGVVLLGASSCIKDVGVSQCPDGNWCAPDYQCIDRDSDGVYECILDSCGNGQLDSGEDCDDGAGNSDTTPDACRADCTLPRCGDGVTDNLLGEMCDDGNRENCDGCRADCSGVETGCGDGYLCGDEVCDDGNTDDCDGCHGDCSGVETGCGDGFICANAGEVCDDGNNDQRDDCPDGVPVSQGGCQPAVCGDGFTKTLGTPPLEECDDGNHTDGDLCPDGVDGDCHLAGCGDGIIQVGVETCDCGLDPANLPPGCTTINSNQAGADCRENCTQPACGDNIVDVGAGEECDQGLQNSNTIPDRCRENCILPFCGDGVVDASNMEQCDCGLDPAHLPAGCGGVNNDTAPSPCRSNCVQAVCGNGAVDPGEECDDGNLSNDDSCLNGCHLNTCGDGYVNTGVEICDCGTDPLNVPAGCGGINSDANPNPCRANCTTAQCGNGIVEGTEQCDDGNQNNDSTPDACRTNCRNAYCGDGVRDTGEACDDGANNSNTIPDVCRLDCSNPSCGDGVTDTGEACDDGIQNSDTLPNRCRTDCSNPTCGDNVTDIGEECDDGTSNSNTVPNACRTDCRAAYCGDNVVDTGEACDDGNTIDNDGCRNNCTSPGCGDGVVQSGAGETCDCGLDPLNLPSGCTHINSNTTPNACRLDCHLPSCGDSVQDSGEQCDDGNGSNTDACLNNCQANTCGDGFQNPVAEACDCGTDAGNLPAGCNAINNDTAPDPCRADCTRGGCGNGIQELGEACDDGNSDNTDTCLSTCVLAFCGDTFVRSVAPVEACDDGGNNDCTGTCNANCTGPSNTCGDGIPRCGEQCDQGAANSDSTPDACRTDCTNPRCGDGVTDPSNGEECDDANTNNADDCLNTCKLNVCGDGVRKTSGTLPLEQCDDGNHSNTDACPDDVANGGTCQTAYCGDGFLYAAGGEACDDGNAINCDTCSNGCTNITGCGDGETCGTEECDTGGGDTAACDGPGAGGQACTFSSCGDSYTNAAAGEACDPGGSDSAGCDGPGAGIEACTLAQCGDTYTNNAAGEACDPGGTDNASCDGPGAGAQACTAAQCGDGYRNAVAGEACDPGGTDSASCDGPSAGGQACTAAQCGDGYTNIQAGEGCDPGPTDSAACDGPGAGGQACTPAVCNDGYRNQVAGEVCDDGLTDDCNGTCNATCDGSANICGDGIIRCGETCDATGGADTALCDGSGAGTEACTAASCGDGYANAAAGETCDDGLNDDCAGTCNAACNGLANTCGDGITRCSEDCDNLGGADTALCDGSGAGAEACTNVQCGDGYTNATAGEACDDGNTSSCDGCAGDCSRPDDVCGDDIAECGEECDTTDLQGYDCTNCPSPPCNSNWDSGTLACTGGCVMDTSGCYLGCTQTIPDCQPIVGTQCLAGSCDPAGNTCSDSPQTITGSGSYAGDTRNMTSDYNLLGNGLDCSDGNNNSFADGPDQVWVVTLQAGEYISVWVDPNGGWDPMVALVSGCPTPTCVTGRDRAMNSNDPERLDYVSASGGTYYLIVDGDDTGDNGEYGLNVTIGSGVVTDPSAGDLIYVELHADPAGNNNNCEWFEIYNTAGSPINLNGFTFTSSCHNNFTVDRDLIIASGEYLVLANRAESNGNCGASPISWEYGTDHLSHNNQCTVEIQDGTTQVIDSLDYDYSGGSWPHANGESMYVCDSFMDSVSNNDATAWRLDSTNNYSGSEYGTPALANPNAGGCP